MREVRRRLTLLGTATSLALTAAVVTAAPAEARRNVGGSEPDASICVLPGRAELGSTGSGLGAICLCVLVPGSASGSSTWVMHPSSPGGKQPPNGSCSGG